MHPSHDVVPFRSPHRRPSRSRLDDVAPAAAPARYIAFGDMPLYSSDAMAALVTAVAAGPAGASHWSVPNRPGRPLQPDDVVGAVDGRPTVRRLRFERRQAPAWSAEVGLGRRAGLALTADRTGRDGALQVEHLLDLFDRVDAALRPDMSIAWLGPDPRSDGAVAEQLDLHRMRLAAAIGPAVFGRCGPRGLSTRTLLGDRYVELVGRDHLAATPLVVTDVGDAGVRLDLVADPAELERDSAPLVARWRAATDHLEPTGLFDGHAELPG